MCLSSANSSTSESGNFDADDAGSDPSTGFGEESLTLFLDGSVFLGVFASDCFLEVIFDSIVSLIFENQPFLYPTNARIEPPNTNVPVIIAVFHFCQKLFFFLLTQ